MSGELLSVTDLDVMYRTSGEDVFAVTDATFAIGPRDSVGVIGETGCGKSSLARAIVGLLPTRAVISGSIRFAGAELVGIPARELRRIRASSLGFIPQNSVSALNPVVRLDQQFRDVLRLTDRKISRAEVRDRAADLLSLAGIRDPSRVLDGYPHHLSGGMAQRVVICLTMIRNPTLVVADEPTTGLDLSVLRQVLDLLAEMRARSNASMIMVTHQIEVVAQYCRSVLVMYGGRVVEAGPVAEVLTRPQHPYTRLLIDSLPERGKPLKTIPGIVRPVTARPHICVFRERCPIADDRCADAVPPRQSVGPDHWVEAFCRPGDAVADQHLESVGRHVRGI